jgi:hypothetical protein
MNIKQAIARLTDRSELEEIRRVAWLRIQELDKQDHENKVARAWERAKTWAVGQKIYANMPNRIVMGCEFKHGDCVGEFEGIRPRARSFLIRMEGKVWRMPKELVELYGLQNTPPQGEAQR